MDIRQIVKSDYIVLDEEATFAELIGKLKQYEKRSALIFRKDKYVGLVEKKRLLRSTMDAAVVKIKKHIQKTPVLNENADVIESAYLMVQSNLSVVPIERNKKVIGVLESLDLANCALALPELKDITVSDLKIIKPTSLKKDDPVAAVIEIMHTEHVDHVPIMDKGKLYGILSYKDLMRRYLNWSPKRDSSFKFNKMASTRSAEVDMPQLSQLPVHNFSSNDDLLTVTQKDSLQKVLQLMTTHGVHDVIVMRNGEMAGLVTVQNILRQIASLKNPQKFNIQFIGLNQAGLQPYHKASIQKIASNEAAKLQREIQNEFTLIIHVKAYEKDAKKHNYSIHLRIEYPGQIITVSQDDWDVEAALHMTFENAHNVIKKKFRTDTSKKRFQERR